VCLRATAAVVVKKMKKQDPGGGRMRGKTGGGGGGGERGTLLRLCYRQYEAIERWNTVKHFAQFPSQTICL